MYKEVLYWSSIGLQMFFYVLYYLIVSWYLYQCTKLKRLSNA